MTRCLLRFHLLYFLFWVYLVHTACSWWKSSQDSIPVILDNNSNNRQNHSTSGMQSWIITETIKWQRPQTKDGLIVTVQFLAVFIIMCTCLSLTLRSCLRSICNNVFPFISHKFPWCCLWKSSSLVLMDDGPFSAPLGRLLSAVTFCILTTPWHFCTTARTDTFA